jgi:hypothetical protein
MYMIYSIFYLFGKCLSLFLLKILDIKFDPYTYFKVCSFVLNQLKTGAVKKILETTALMSFVFHVCVFVILQRKDHENKRLFLISYICMTHTIVHAFNLLYESAFKLMVNGQYYYYFLTKFLK